MRAVLAILLASLAFGQQPTTPPSAHRRARRPGEVKAPEEAPAIDKVVQTLDRPPYSFAILENRFPADEEHPNGRLERKLRITRARGGRAGERFNPSLKARDSRGNDMDYGRDHLSIEAYDAHDHILYLSWEQAVYDHTVDAALLAVDAATGRLDVLAGIWWPISSLELSPDRRYLLCQGYGHASARCCTKWELIDLKTRSHVNLEAGSQESNSPSEVQREQEKKRYCWLPDGRLQLELQLVYAEKESDQVWRPLQVLLPLDPSLAWKPLSE